MDYKTFIKSKYPEATIYSTFVNNLMADLEKKENIKKENILVATSVCADELNHGAHFHQDSYLKEFALGGLAGFPFTGVTGINAYLSHIPDDGAGLIIYGPHIGLTLNGESGLVKRENMKEPTITCGALGQVTNMLNEKNNGDANVDPLLDPQVKYLYENIKKTLQVENKVDLPSLTNSMVRIIKSKLEKLLDHAESRKMPVYLAGGIIINTDSNYPDYFQTHYFKRWQGKN